MPVEIISDYAALGNSLTEINNNFHMMNNRLCGMSQTKLDSAAFVTYVQSISADIENTYTTVNTISAHMNDTCLLVAGLKDIWLSPWNLVYSNIFNIYGSASEIGNWLTTRGIFSVANKTIHQDQLVRVFFHVRNKNPATTPSVLGSNTPNTVITIEDDLGSMSFSTDNLVYVGSTNTGLPVPTYTYGYAPAGRLTTYTLTNDNNMQYLTSYAAPYGHTGAEVIDAITTKTHLLYLQSTINSTIAHLSVSFNTFEAIAELERNLVVSSDDTITSTSMPTASQQTLLLIHPLLSQFRVLYKKRTDFINKKGSDVTATMPSSTQAYFLDADIYTTFIHNFVFKYSTNKWVYSPKYSSEIFNLNYCVSDLQTNCLAPVDVNTLYKLGCKMLMKYVLTDYPAYSTTWLSNDPRFEQYVNQAVPLTIESVYYPKVCVSRVQEGVVY